jgi:hypothetical protein
MKYLKNFNENSVRLAANLYLNSKEGDWISGINDPFTIRIEKYIQKIWFLMM